MRYKMKIKHMSIFNLLRTAALIVLCISVSLFAQENTRGTQKLTSDINEFKTVRAVIVGVSKYKEIESLKYAHTDAISFYDFLRSASGGYVDSDNIILLTDTNATAAQIYRALNWIRDESDSGDLAIFFFAGHGDVETVNILPKGYLLAYNSPKTTYPAGGTINIGELQNYLVTIVGEKRSHVILISDACRSGKLAGGLQGVKQTTAALQENWGNIVKILSSQPSELSYESTKWGNGAGVFTYYLLRGLMGMADLDTNKQVTLMELEFYLKKNISRETNESQNPIIRGNVKTILADVDSLALATVLINEGQSKPISELLSMRGDEAKSSSLDTVTLKLIKQFRFSLKNGSLVDSKYGDESAWAIYNMLKDREDLKADVTLMKTDLIASLQDQSQIVINSFLEGTDRADTRDLNTAYQELRYAISMIDEEDMLYNSIRARLLFLKSRLYSDNEIDKRINKLHECLALEPDASYAYCELGQAYYISQRYDEAKVSLRKAIDLSPRWAYPWLNLGYTYNALNQFDSTIVCYKKSAELKDYAKPYYYLGIVYSDIGELDKAIENYNKVIEIDPEYGDVYYNLGILYYNLKDYENAIKFCTKYIEYYPTNHYGYQVRGVAYLCKGDNENALKDLNKLIEINSAEFTSLIEKYRK